MDETPDNEIFAGLPLVQLGRLVVKGCFNWLSQIQKQIKTVNTSCSIIYREKQCADSVSFGKQLFFGLQMCEKNDFSVKIT